MSSLTNREISSGVSRLSIPTAAVENSQAIGETLLYFWTEKMLTDVQFTIICGEDQILFSAHRLILSIWSPVLADTLFKDPNRKVEDVIEVTDTSPTAFETMLKFMYGSKAELHQQRKNVDFLLKVCKVATKYKVEALKVMCCEMISCTIPNVQNVFALLEASLFVSSNILEQRCYKVLQSQTGQILADVNLSDLTPAMIQTILKLPSVSLSSEYELAIWVFAWAKSKYVCDEEDFKTVLFEAVPYLKLTSLSANEFGLLLKNNMEWIDEKDGLNIFMNIVIPGSRPLPEWCQNSLKIKREYNFCP